MSVASETLLHPFHRSFCATYLLSNNYSADDRQNAEIDIKVDTVCKKQNSKKKINKKSGGTRDKPCLPKNPMPNKPIFLKLYNINDRTVIKHLEDHI